MKRTLICLVLAAGALSVQALALYGRAATAAKVTAHFYRLAAALDTNSIKAIGSVDTKVSPTVLQVSKAEAGRITEIVTKAGGSLLGSPSVITPLDQQASISTNQDDGTGCKMTVIPSTKSDTITLKFKLSATTIQGNRKVTRSASGMARVVESRSLLLIENPRDGQPGLMVVLEAVRTRGK